MVKGRRWHILMIKCLVQSLLYLKLVYECVNSAPAGNGPATHTPVYRSAASSQWTLSSGRSPPTQDSSPPSHPSGEVTFQLQAELTVTLWLNINLSPSPYCIITFFLSYSNWAQASFLSLSFFFHNTFAWYPQFDLPGDRSWHPACSWSGIVSLIYYLYPL